MESKYKFKSYKPDNNIKSGQCFKVDLYTVNQRDFEGIFKRLESVEKAVRKLNIDYDESISKDNNNNKEVEKYGKATVNLKIIKIFNYDDYPSQLLNFYFIYQHFYSNPSFISIKEYYECMAHFNGKIPEYLVYAIMSKASLNSPSPQLYRKNLDYCNYYYELSVKHLNICISKNEIDIYMLHTLSILSWVDAVLNRQFLRFSRVATSTKLAQIMGLCSPLLNLLKNQQFSIMESSKNKVRLGSPYFFYYGNLLLDLIEKLNQELDNRKSSKIRSLLEIAITEFDSFSTLISNLKNDWEGSDKFLKSLTERYKSIKLAKINNT
ncbi:hypothetical protein CONCODRAFT_1968 [Conidiobolus coronatus NRRL 28638]|uniref:Uncharacterized protein n=1 Tax=Conidiobolus coronatus (strain ATCC 28846 / CBS 209.66 / NRRL 28638) TaxID=796925 RepID=A0A137PIR2_CONC2|nr:hypothetical protein CONCODRAFT_1968 [Conidiobolus coronatus NRRL 28638]|eukprot:KXN74898.1 hypothetical protein CONCODRAFT_1968 [Conidiobolus coronatus NRRL 28638]